MGDSRIAYRVVTFAVFAVLMTPSLMTPGCFEGDDGEDAASSFESIVDIYLPSNSTGMSNGRLAVRLHLPEPGGERYDEGSPILIIGEGGTDVDGLANRHVPGLDDMIVVTFIYPGGENTAHGRRSDGVYDYRGPLSIMAMRDVILYAAGELADATGGSIDDHVPYPVRHGNIGVLGISFGGNIGIAVAAVHPQVSGHLDYVVQWETPVSSQIATRDLGRMLLEPLEAGDPIQTDYSNPRYLGYGERTVNVSMDDIVYDPDSIYPVFHDGNGDGTYTTINGSRYSKPSPDLNGNGTLEVDEDFGLDTYPYDTYDTDGKVIYSRAVTHALDLNDAFNGSWPAHIANVTEADRYWNVRESVRLYEQALANVPDLEGMFLLSLSDHVQSNRHKTHAHQATDGWTAHADWFKINPDPSYIFEVDPALGGTPLPSVPANAAPDDWDDHHTYCIPEFIDDQTYRIAGVHQMADRVQG